MTGSPASRRRRSHAGEASRRGADALPVRLVSPRDLTRLITVAMGYCLASLLPQRLDAALSDFVARSSALAGSKRVANAAHRMQDVLGSSHPRPDWRQLAREHVSIRSELAWGRIRLLHRSPWRVAVELSGREHLEAARRNGRGAILWLMSFCDLPIVNMACAKAGFPLTHLSHYHHGSWTRTRFAYRLNARFYTAAEERFLMRRVVIGPDHTLGYLRALRDDLAANQTISIMGEHESRAPVPACFFGRRIRLATGAPALAWGTGAPLLPVHAHRAAPGRYRAVIRAPIRLDRGVRREDWIQQSVDEFIGCLERCIVEHPASWMGWKNSGFSF